jgi:hypothetical protein
VMLKRLWAGESCLQKRSKDIVFCLFYIYISVYLKVVRCTAWRQGGVLGLGSTLGRLVDASRGFEGKGVMIGGSEVSSA